jgi:hypothetical protein
MISNLQKLILCPASGNIEIFSLAPRGLNFFCSTLVGGMAIGLGSYSTNLKGIDQIARLQLTKNPKNRLFS